jgi:hypothetical protein
MRCAAHLLRSHRSPQNSAPFSPHPLAREQGAGIFVAPESGMPSNVVIMATTFSGNVAANGASDVHEESSGGTVTFTAGCTSDVGYPDVGYTGKSPRGNRLDVVAASIAGDIGGAAGDELFSYSSCALCPAGTYRSTGSSECRTCNLGTSHEAMGSIDLNDCYQCDPGKYGKYDGVRRPDMILIDASDSHGSDSHFGGIPVCTMCEGQTITMQVGQTYCMPCPELISQGSFPSDYIFASATHDICELGCVAGEGVRPNEASCSPCGVGEWSSTEDNSPCVSCGPGACARKARPNKNQSQLTLYSALGTATAGTNSVSIDDCVACDVGKYKPVDSVDPDCLECAVGKSNPNEGSYTVDDCIACVAGRYAPVGAAETCTACGQGKYSAAIGATISQTCEPCAPGTSTEGVEGVDSCTNCPAGSSAPSTGYASCAACVPGTYSESEASTACTACAAGE